MKFYRDITLLPNVEANIGFIWQKVYGQVHLALVEQKTESGNSAIAISFPEFGNRDFPLGSKLRLIAPESEQLQKLNIGKVLNRLTDYTHCTSIKEVPETVEQYACFKPKRFKNNPERLARRRAKRKSESFDEALAHYAGYEEQKSNLPYVNVQSFSKGTSFKLFIEKVVTSDKVPGEFSCYGLSSVATTPWF
ncbi:MAG: type I-F CRISPR-associated endoribonuclease Cas6/Csy4 [Pseudomonadales bacterium]|nr:type I-F CRISPR-associated endoribonuclease Cas6/Csy4 [Pseudomonadales bacterium]